jgi:hypothetical protein
MGIRWHLRLRRAEKGMFQTSDLVPLLAERGVYLRGSRYSGWSLSPAAGAPDRHPPTRIVTATP